MRMIGMKIPKDCVFGETVNIATAMEELADKETNVVNFHTID